MMHSILDSPSLIQCSPWPSKSHFGVLGCGISGKSAVRLLLKLGMQVTVLEQNTCIADEEFFRLAEGHGVQFIFGEHKKEHFLSFDYLVVSPGAAPQSFLPFIEDTNTKWFGELELALSFIQSPIIALTGTSGKTTSVSLIAAMLEHAGKRVFLGGNIGVPLSDLVVSEQDVDVVVLELSSFQLQGLSSLHAHAAVLLNLTENHLDQHLDMKEYSEAKSRIFMHQQDNDYAFFPQEFLSLYQSSGSQAQYSFLELDEDFSGLKLAGRHNQMNASVAYAVCKLFGVSKSQALEAARSFLPLRHRLEFVCEEAGVRYINDSKSTTVESLTVALESFSEPIFLLAGGKFKGGDLESLQGLVKQKLKKLILFGASQERFVEAFTGLVPIAQYQTLEEAMVDVKKEACSGDVVLLSPATSSFDQFPNYMARGDLFCRLACSGIK